MPCSKMKNSKQKDSQFMKLTIQIEILDLSPLESNMRRVGLEMKSDQQVRHFFSAIMMTGLSIIQNGDQIPSQDYTDLVKTFLTNPKGKVV